jgi:hypothetical protein
MTRADALLALRQDLANIPDLDLQDEPGQLLRCSRDAYDYSPVLTPKLAGARAQLVSRPQSVAAVEQLAAACAKHGVPLTVRGAGTGNYGQCVPLEGGMVMLTTGLQRIRRFDPATGVVTVEPGCQMSHLDQELRRHQRELRLLPSTWRSATVGGFVAGGSGGIGSIRWGFLRDPGHLLGLEVVPMTTDAHCHQLDEIEAEALNHSYGTNGIITALTLSTAPAVSWHQVCIDCMDWGRCRGVVVGVWTLRRVAPARDGPRGLRFGSLAWLEWPGQGATQVVVVGGPGWHRKPETVSR